MGKVNPSERLTGYVVKQPGQRLAASKYITELKQIGKEAGESVAEEKVFRTTHAGQWKERATREFEEHCKKGDGYLASLCIEGMGGLTPKQYGKIAIARVNEHLALKEARDYINKAGASPKLLIDVAKTAISNPREYSILDSAPFALELMEEAGAGPEDYAALLEIANKNRFVGEDIRKKLAVKSKKDSGKSDSENQQRPLSLFQRTIQNLFPRKTAGLEARLSVFIALMGFLGGLFFLSSNITGNVVGLSAKSNSLIGSALILVGVIAGFFWVNKKNIFLKERGNN